jgi:hypothetical protein
MAIRTQAGNTLTTRRGQRLAAEPPACWLLVRAFSDARATAWQLGDIVEVRPGDFTDWGAMECLPRFYRVRVTGISPARIKARLEAVDQTEVYNVEMDTTSYVHHRDRRYGMRVGELPSLLQTALQTTGVIEVTRSQVFGAIRDNADVVASLD